MSNKERYACKRYKHNSYYMKYMKKQKKQVLKSFRKITALFLALIFVLGSLSFAGISLQFQLPISAATSTVPIPQFTDGTLNASKELAFQCKGLYYSSVTLKEYTDYLTEFEHYGFQIEQDHTIGNNRYVTFIGDSGMVHTTYHSVKSAMYIITDPLTQTDLKTSEPAWTKITDTTLSIFSLNYTHRELTDANGKCYIITLEDGRYIILDGGYTYDAERIYNFLADNNKRPDGQIVIAAWCFSHDHGDHVGAFQQFSTTHAKDVTLQAVLTNPTIQATSGYSGTFLSQTLPNTLKQYYGDVKYYVPHTGQRYTFCDVTFDIYYTHEDMYYNNASCHGNNTSTAMKMTVNGQTFLFTGDMEDGSCNTLVDALSGALHCDFMQIPHHGYGGCTKGLFDAVSPSYTLWTTSQAALALRTNGIKYQWISSGAVSVNKHIADTVGLENCWPADGAVEILTLPYVPNQSKIESYTPSDTAYSQKTRVPVTVGEDIIPLPKGEIDLSACFLGEKQFLYAKIEQDGTTRYVTDPVIDLQSGMNVTATFVKLSTLSGAAVLIDNPTAMIWETAIGREDYAQLLSLCDSGELQSIEIGTLVAETDTLKESNEDLTWILSTRQKKSIAKKVTANTEQWHNSAPEGKAYEGYEDCYIYAVYVPEIDPHQYEVRCSAVGYLRVTLADGTALCIYGGYDEEKHARSAADIGRMALADPNRGLTNGQIKTLQSMFESDT